MSKFIKLNSIIINITHIVNIIILPTKYTIFMSNKYLTGYFILGSGSIDSIGNTIDICKNRHPQDYKMIKEWIDQIE